MSNNSKRISIAVIMIIAIIIIIPIIMPVFLDLFKSGGKEAAKKYLRSFGAKGIIIIFVLQIIQVLSIIIPAPPVWIIAGMTYGVFGGMLICIGGVVIGNAIAFYIGRRFGNKLINVLINKKIRNKLKFLETSDHSAIIEFLLYVIPGVPNNIIPYVYAQTSVSLKKFISIIAIASIPAILSCTFVGHNILSTNIEFVIVVIIIFIILIAIILINNKKIMDWMEKFSS